MRVLIKWTGGAILGAVAAFLLFSAATELHARVTAADSSGELLAAAGATPTQARPARVQLPSLPAGAPGRFSVPEADPEDDETQASARTRLHRRWQAFRSEAGMTAEQEEQVLAAIFQAQVDLAGVREADVNEMYEAVNVGSLRGEAAAQKAREMFDERDNQAAEAARTSLDTVEADLKAAVAKVLTPEQLEAWHFSIVSLDIVETFIYDRK
jgi:hypothetical protein